MRTFRSPFHFPPLLLLFSFAIAAPVALEVELLQLTPDNFKSSIADGVWFVEHFSPYCHHCQGFAPTWTHLTEDVMNNPDPGIHLAQINCAVYGDLCEENKVKYFPQLNLYRNGEFVDTFEGVREYDALLEYMNKHAEPTSTLTPTPQAPPSATSPSTVELPTVTKSVEVLHVQTPRADVNPSGSVLELGPHNFQDVVDQGPVFVKYFAPWCGHCKKLAPTWKQLARHMQHKLNIAEVNCEVHAALCKTEDVPGFPMLVYYANGVKSEYSGGRKFDLLKAFTERAASTGLQNIRVEDLEENVRNHSVAYLLVYPASDSHILNEVTQASGVLLGSVPIYTSSSSELFTRFSISTPWALLALKDFDASGATAVYHKRLADKADISKWLIANRIPTTVELSQETFQLVMNAPHKPLVVIAPVNKGKKEKVAEKMKEIGKKWRVRKLNKGNRDVVFTWMDTDKWASWLKNMYGVKATEEPTVIVADHSRLQYFDRDQAGQTIKLTSLSVFATLDGINKGSIPSKSSENFAERISRYLNDKLRSLENFVINKPLYAVTLVAIVLVLFFLAMRRAMADDNFTDPRENRHGKSRRLD
ncbi:hypothetical protein PILCRDRAFT_823363 [Piloderma croceum F 1598]|uniref:Thioredoxin domain-containing protein n=1 Tax=Piloderma croceum (strain F 1598) TaxID=765440 RepID=A0A0C3AZP6_PILCF|nr:hypothetical protein PILCRDRAFT_823363 [Piloderma croceum F 1598]